MAQSTNCVTINFEMIMELLIVASLLIHLNYVYINTVSSLLILYASFFEGNNCKTVLFHSFISILLTGKSVKGSMKTSRTQIEVHKLIICKRSYYLTHYGNFCKPKTFA